MLSEIHYVSSFQFSRNVTDSASCLSSGPVVVMFVTRLLLLASLCGNTSLLPAHHSTYLLPGGAAISIPLLSAYHSIVACQWIQKYPTVVSE
jgi:hypothetical protein